MTLLDRLVRANHNPVGRGDRLGSETVAGLDWSTFTPRRRSLMLMLIPELRYLRRSPLRCR